MIALLAPYLTRIGGIAALLLVTWLHGCHFGDSLKDDKLKSVQGAYDAYKANVEAAGRIAQMNADAIKAKDIERKAASDESYAKALTVLGSDIERLRKRTSSGAYDLPAPSSSTVCPDGLRCFDRQGFDSALREFETETDGFVAEGAALKLRMDEAIRWANRLN